MGDPLLLQSKIRYITKVKFQKTTPTYRWFWFVLRRLFFSRGREHSFLPTLSTTIGVALGVLTLFVVVSTMNGFQQGFISSINEVGSYHLIITPSAPLTERLSQPEERLALLDSLDQQEGITVAIPFLETKSMIQSPFSSPQGVSLRGVPSDILERDPGFQEKIRILKDPMRDSLPDFFKENREETSQNDSQNDWQKNSQDPPREGFNLEPDSEGVPSLILAVGLAQRLDVSVGSYVSLLALHERDQNHTNHTNQQETRSGLQPRQESFRVSALFETDYYEYNYSLAFIELEEAKREGFGNAEKIGIKLTNRFHDLRVQRELVDLPALEGSQVRSWREFNRAFFGALRIEKITISLLLSLIFIVVAMHLNHALTRTVEERLEELAILKAMGTNGGELRLLFLGMSLIATSIGIVVGLLVGWQLLLHLDEILFFFYRLFLYRFLYSSASLEIPVQIIPQDLIFIITIPLLFSFVAAWRATSVIVKIYPAEVLRYE